MADRLDLTFGDSTAKAALKTQGYLSYHIKKSMRALAGLSTLDAICGVVGDNLESIRSHIKANENEGLCLAFLLMLAVDPELSNAADVLDRESDEDSAEAAIAAAVGLPLAAVTGAFAPNGCLMVSGLISRERSSRSLKQKYAWPTPQFPREMLSRSFDPIVALREQITYVPKADIVGKDFDYLGEIKHIALSYLTRAMADGVAGVNILLHGANGAGKTEFTRTLAKHLSCDVLDIMNVDRNGETLDSSTRLGALCRVQALAKGRRGIVVFDRAESVHGRPLNRQPQNIKEFLQGAFRTNSLMTLWLTSEVSELNPECIGQFDLVIEVKNQPARQREQAFRNLPLTLPDESIAKLAACEGLSPSAICRAATVATSVSNNVHGIDPTRGVVVLVNELLRAQRKRVLQAHACMNPVYEPAYINCDSDPLDLLDGLQRVRSARICFYGPPGTGKTAFAQWLAQQLDMPLHTKQASDLMSCFSGETEKRFAQTFREAQEANAILLIDEVDSFLQDRSRAHRSWEVTSVNEFLTQMERFSGLFIASTNLIQGFDPAAMRRFDLKAKFDFLRREQARELLQAHLKVAGLHEAEEFVLGELDSLEKLTPGDFALIARQSRFKALPSPRHWVEALARECSHKNSECSRRIGFSGVFSHTQHMA